MTFDLRNKAFMCKEIFGFHEPIKLVIIHSMEQSPTSMTARRLFMNKSNVYQRVLKITIFIYTESSESK